MHNTNTLRLAHSETHTFRLIQVFWEVLGAAALTRFALLSHEVSYQGARCIHCPFNKKKECLPEQKQFNVHLERVNRHQPVSKVRIFGLSLAENSNIMSSDVTYPDNFPLWHPAFKLPTPGCHVGCMFFFGGGSLAKKEFFNRLSVELLY